MSDLVVGSTVAGCRLEAVAGRGGMGVVWRATQLALNRAVAVKAIAPQFAEDAAFRERFQRESQLAASIEHPNVIPVYEAGELDDRLYLIMRWVDGTDLRQLLDKCGRLAPTTATRLLMPVALALGAAHRRGLIHRDVKPANVLISGYEGDEEHVYLTDFGVARRAGGDMTVTRTGVLVGTLDYIAPERIEGGKGDAASDVYAFGCMLYEVLTGGVPYERPSELTKMHAHLNDQVPSARAKTPDVPERLDAIISKAMAKQPEARFGSAEQLAAALTRSLEPRGAVQPDRPTVRSEAVTDASELVGATGVVAPGPAATGASETVAEDVPTRVTGAETQIDDGTPTFAHRRSRRRAALALPVAVLAVIGVVVAVLISGGGGKQPAVDAASASVARSAGVAGPTAGLAATGGLRVVRRIQLPGTPSAIAADPFSDRVWVTGPGYVVAKPGTFSASVNGTPSAIAAGNGQVWISDPTAGQLHRFTVGGGGLVSVGSISSDASQLELDPRDGSAYVADSTGRVGHVGLNLQLTQLGVVTPAPTDLAFGEGNWLWAVNGKQLVRMDPSGSVPTATFPDGSDPVAVCLNQGVWAAHGNGHVTRFDPRPTFKLPNGTTANGLHVNADLAVAAPSTLSTIVAIENGPDVWTLSPQTRTLYRIDYSTRHVSGTLTLRSTPIGLAVSSRSAWIITRDAMLIQIRG